MPPVDRERAERAVAELLRALGHPPESEAGLGETPARVVQALATDLLDGYGLDPAEILAPVASAGGELVLACDLPLQGLCAHHLLPFHGVAHVAYRPRTKVTGLSCLGRLVDCFAHRLTLQEQVGLEVTGALVRELDAWGAACILEAQHTCMIARGARQAGSRVTTVSLAGTMAAGGADHALLWGALGRPVVGSGAHG